MSFTHSPGEVLGCQRCTVQAIVNSVGPYRFSTTEFGAAACHCSALARGKGSPQNRLQRSVGRVAGPSKFRFRICAGIDGTENQTVSSFLLMNLLGARRSMGDMA